MKSQQSITKFFKPIPRKNANEENIQPSKKQKRLVVDSDDEENIAPKTPLKLDQFRANSTPGSSTAGSPFATPRTPFTRKDSTPISTPTKSQRFKEKNEERYSWLLNVKDANKNPIGSKNYDPRTLWIPPRAWAEFTPFEKQFWEIKAKNYDTVVFFKKGKFYELYENDATIGHQQFDLKLTDRVNMRMVGVPESSFHHWASQFIAKGYKVAKVDQMENAMGKMIREQETPKKDSKIIQRELTTVLTTGTLVDGDFLTTDMSTYCMSIKEDGNSFGISFIDTATAEINITSFEDDENKSQFETILTQINPKELVLEKGGISKAALKIIKNNLLDVQSNYLQPHSEFWSAEVTLDELQNGKMLSGNLPPSLDEISKKPNALSSLGGLLSYLRTLKMDRSMITANNIHIYDSMNSISSLLLDGQTLVNLEIFKNNTDGTDKGTLFKLLNHCVTPFGKRLFKKWVCHPLRNIQNINSRLDAIEDINSIPAMREQAIDQFKKLPDLERILARIHSGNCLVKDFVLALDSFRGAQTIFKIFEEYIMGFKSDLMREIVEFKYPEALCTVLKELEAMFDQGEARNSGKLLLNEGFDEQYDELRSNVNTLEDKLESYRKTCEKENSCRIAFKDIGKEIYQMEVSAKVKVPRDWTVMSKTKDVNRYYNSKLRGMITNLQEAKERCDIAMRDIKLRIYEKFDNHYLDWMKVTKNISNFDCLLSLAICSENLEGHVCRPELVDEVGVFDAKNLSHPCIAQSLDSEYIPNDLQLGDNNPKMILLTGPNMGGKSTLLRQTCIAAIMAQIGCFVPAESFRLSPFDRIFTRIGANDNIMAGMSTFMVELNETSKILQEATPRSLVILDELGRGTSTFDGYAIAYAVLYYLITKSGCLGLFSTHYGTLTKEFEKSYLVSLKYMSFLVDQESQLVTFLYKLVDGICPESYGMNVARMAQIPTSIIEQAETIAAEFDQSHTFNTSGNGVTLYDIVTFKDIVDSKVHPIVKQRILTGKV